MRTIKLGILVPSSNTAMEPIISQMLTDISNERKNFQITAHFSRVQVTTISNDASSASQFDIEKMLSAASLLADAKVDAIGWGGTSGGWLGPEADLNLCQAIEERFGVLAFTSSGSFLHAFGMLKINNLGLVTPYTNEMNETIKRNYTSFNFKIVTGYDGLALTDNIEIGNVSESQLRDITGRVLQADGSLEAIMTFCKNFKTATFAAAWEQELSRASRDIYIIDSVTVLVWTMLRFLEGRPVFGNVSQK